MDGGLQHINGNQLCAIDIETTGLNPEIDEILQLAIIPLNCNFEMRKDVVPFNMFIRPELIEDKPRLCSVRLWESCMQYGLPQSNVRDALEDWVETLKLPYLPGGARKRMIPIGHNYVQFDRSFLINWLGPLQYDYWFDYHVRDTMQVATYWSDYASFHLADQVPFAKYKLGWCCSKMGIKNECPHDAFHDALATARLYKRLCEIFWNHIAFDAMIPDSQIQME